MSAAGHDAQQNMFNEAFTAFLKSDTVPRIKPGMSQTEIRKISAVPLEQAFLEFLSEPKQLSAAGHYASLNFRSEPKQMSYDEFLATKKKPVPPAGEIRKAGVNSTPRASWKLEK